MNDYIFTAFDFWREKTYSVELNLSLEADQNRILQLMNDAKRDDGTFTITPRFYDD